MGLVDRRPVVCRNLAMGFWVPLHSFTLSSSDEIWRRQEQCLAHSPQDGHLVPFPLLLTSSTQVSTLEVELGSLDNCSLER